MPASSEPAVDLATRQRQLRDLIKDRASVPPDADPYLREAAASPGLPIVREIVHWWRALGIERTCPLTTAVLKRRGRFDAMVAVFIRDHAISPYRDELGPRFLAATETDGDPLIATLARFELALIRARRGDPVERVVDWPYDPYAVLKALVGGLPLDEAGAGGTYQTVVSAALPRLFRVLGTPDALG